MSTHLFDLLAHLVEHARFRSAEAEDYARSLLDQLAPLPSPEKKEVTPDE